MAIITSFDKTTKEHKSIRAKHTCLWSIAEYPDIKYLQIDCLNGVEHRYGTLHFDKEMAIELKKAIKETFNI